MTIQILVVTSTLVMALVSGAVAAEESPRPAARPVRVVLASAKLPSVTDTPLHVRLLRVSLLTNQSATYRGPGGFLFVLAGTIEAVLDADKRPLREGDAVHVGSGQAATMRAVGPAGATLLHFVLLAAHDAATAGYGGSTNQTELYRSPQPLPGLQHGPYEFALTRVTSPAKAAPPPLHHRSGAALYFVLAGSGILHMEGGRSEPRGRGAVQLETREFVHTWENAGDTPLVLLQANISPEGAPEIIWLR